MPWACSAASLPVSVREQKPVKYRWGVALTAALRDLILSRR